MSLRPGEQRALGQIERALRACDPKLEGMLSIFTRLTAHELLPSEGLLPVTTAQKTVRRAAATRPGGMSRQRRASARNGNHLDVATGVFVACTVVFFLVVIGFMVAGARTSPAPCSVTWAQASVCQPGHSPSELQSRRGVCSSVAAASVTRGRGRRARSAPPARCPAR